MLYHMLLSIFRHRPSAQVAPQQSPILLIDNLDSTLTVIEVKDLSKKKKLTFCSSWESDLWDKSRINDISRLCC